MAHILIATSLLLLFTLSATTSGVSASAVENLREVESMMETLRPLGYTLFCNAITTSDLQFQILSFNSDSDDFYTIFAAKDQFLYALDMASDAAAYVSTLRYHVSPNHRLTLSDLRNLESPFLQTLLPHYSILVSTSRLNGTGSASAEVVRVDGVRISDPDLFVGSRIAVHGLDGILVTGIVKNDDLDDDLDDDERGLGLAFAPSADPVVMPLPEEDVSVPPSSAPSPPPGVAPGTPPPVEAPSLNTPPSPSPSPPVAVPSPMVAPAPVVAPDTPPPPPPVAFPSPVVVPAPVVAPDQGVVPPGENENDGGKGLKEKPSEKDKPKPRKATDGGKGSKEARRGARHQALKEKESDGGKGSREGRRAKHHRVSHQNHHHQAKHNNRHHQNRRNHHHRRDDL